MSMFRIGCCLLLEALQTTTEKAKMTNERPD